MDRERTPAVAAFWQAFRAARGLEHDTYAVVAFGTTPAVMDELAALALRGTKRATASLVRSFTEDGEEPPVVGGHAVVVDGAGLPVCIFQTTDLRTGPLSSVDDAFAWDEGEGDRTRDWWLSAHRRLFARRAARGSFAFHDAIETVFERFRVVWPEAAADGEG